MRLVSPVWSDRYRDKDYLFAYIGRSSNRVRRSLLVSGRDLSDVCLEDSSESYNHFSKENENRIGRQDYHWDVMARAKYGLCPAERRPACGFSN